MKVQHYNWSKLMSNAKHLSATIKGGDSSGDDPAFSLNKPADQTGESRHERHELSAAFPVLSPIALTQLATSIQEHGQLHDVIRYQGKILDGWNRVLACELVGVDVRVRDLRDDETPLGVVWGNNLDRRDMSKSARASAAAEVFFAMNVLPSTSAGTLGMPHPDALPAVAMDMGWGSSAAPSPWLLATKWPCTKQQLAVRAGVSERLMQDTVRIRMLGHSALIRAVRDAIVPAEEAVKWLALSAQEQGAAIERHSAAAAERRLLSIEAQKQRAAARKGNPSGSSQASLSAPPKTGASIHSDAERPPTTLVPTPLVPTGIGSSGADESSVFAHAATLVLRSCEVLMAQACEPPHVDEIRALAERCQQFVVLTRFNDDAPAMPV
jgi:hypothetical protein